MSAHSSSGRDVSLSDFGAAVRRKWLVALTATLLGLLAGGLLFLATPPQYSATATISLAPAIPDSVSSNGSEVNTATEGATVVSSKVAERAAEKLGWNEGLRDLLEHVAVTSPMDSQVLEIQFTAKNPHDAAVGANAFANAYLSYREDVVGSALQARIESIDARLAQLEVSKLAQAVNLTSRLRDEKATIETTVVDPGRIVNTASEPTMKLFPRLEIFLAGGLLVGLLIGLTAAVSRARKDTRLPGPESLDALPSIPMLSLVPVRETKPGQPPSLAPLFDQGGPEADAYRILALKLTADLPGAARNVLFVEADQADAGMAPFSMALTLAAQGKRTILLASPRATSRACSLLDIDPSDADVRNDGLHECGTIGRLHLVSFGDEVALDATISCFQEFLSELRDGGMLIVDGINVELPSSTLTLTRLVDLAVVWTRENRTHLPVVEERVHELRQLGVRQVGTVLTRSCLPRNGSKRPRERPQNVLGQLHRAASAVND